LGIGTNNCNPSICPGSIYGDQYYDHGQAWALLVNDVGSYLVTYGLFPQVQAFGASDMEVPWFDPNTTKIWVDGYNSRNNWPLINYGDAQGCPQSRLGYNGYCDNGWYQNTIWYLSANINSSMPTPLIYTNDGANARQWYSLSAYAFDLHGGRLNFGGAITQSLACMQVGCNEDEDNTPNEGYLQLFHSLILDPDTSQNIIWSTDFGYSGR
jgi:hypothetical protein